MYLMSDCPPKQAMILAAGEGVRMRPLTLQTPKPLLCVGGQPLIAWHIARLKRMGIGRIVVNARHLAQCIHAFFTDHDFGVPIVVCDETDVGNIETAGGIALALHRGLLKDEPFVLVNGDVWLDDEAWDSANLCLWQQKAHLCLVDNPLHHSEGDFALQGEQVVAEGEKLTFAGLSVLSPTLFDGLAVGTHAPLAPLLKQAIARAEVTGVRLLGKWVDVGTPARLAQLDACLKNTQ